MSEISEGVDEKGWVGVGGCHQLVLRWPQRK